MDWEGQEGGGGGGEDRCDPPTARVFVWLRAPGVEQRIMGLRPVSMVMCRRG